MNSGRWPVRKCGLVNGDVWAQSTPGAMQWTFGDDFLRRRMRPRMSAMYWLGTVNNGIAARSTAGSARAMSWRNRGGDDRRGRNRIEHRARRPVEGKSIKGWRSSIAGPDASGEGLAVTKISPVHPRPEEAATHASTRPRFGHGVGACCSSPAPRRRRSPPASALRRRSTCCRTT
jgi:hypothetical protein